VNTPRTTIVTNAAEPAETTRIPVDPRAGHYGAIAYFAVLCYPGIDPRSHQRRNQLTTALLEYFRGIIKYRNGFKRITRGRAERTTNDWLRQPPSMKNAKVFATGNRAEDILREQRLPCAWIASQLAMLHFSEELERQQSRLQIRLTGPQRLTGLIESTAEQLGLAEPRTMWRYWNETLPVLHLAVEFYFAQPEQQPADRPQLTVRCVRDHHLWLAEAVRGAEVRALDLSTYTAFDPARRICLLPE
jgi:hypothetical protein